MQTLNAKLFPLFNGTFSTPYSLNNLQGLSTFTSNANIELLKANDDMSVLVNQTAIFSILTPPDLAKHFSIVDAYFLQNMKLFTDDFQ
jgi:hypothetical protein